MFDVHRLATVSALFSVLICGRLVAQGERPATELVRYRGVDGVNLMYPSDWARAFFKAPAEMPVTIPSLALHKPGARSPAKFACLSMEFPREMGADERNAKTLATQTVEAVRAQDRKLVINTVNEIDLDGTTGYQFSIMRPRPDGTQLLSINCAADFDGRTYLLSGTCDPADQESQAQIRKMISSVSFGDQEVVDPKALITFINPVPAVRMEIPAHWYDFSEPLSVGLVNRWSIFDGEEFVGSVMVSATPTTPGDSLEGVAATAIAAAKEFDPDAITESEASPLNGRDAITVHARYKGHDDTPTVMHTCGIVEGDTLFGLYLVTTPEHEAKVIDEWRAACLTIGGRSATPKGP